MSAVVAIAAPVAAIAVIGLALVERPLLIPIAAGCLAVAIGAAAYALTRTGARRAVAAELALVAPLVLVVAAGQVLHLLAVIALVAITATATRYALGRDTASLKSGPTPGVRRAGA